MQGIENFRTLIYRRIILTFEKLIFLCFSFFFLGVKVLGMLVPALINFLFDESTILQANKYQKSLHDHSLQWLTKIGPQYPQVHSIIYFKCFKLISFYQFKKYYNSIYSGI